MHAARALSPRPPPYTDVARQFGDLEGIAERCSMAGVSYHLREAKLAWMSEAGSKKTKQTCMAAEAAADKRMSWMSVCCRLEYTVGA